ncbi:hypothetical protein Cni_G12870 [Canna indica]|uniref:Uncharacterized protein n=1 Tax=Canna indica TaxID=4628 RepID=A0AAQ3K8Z4_9LILI|nr:hypothetical protein Cni_G12870 [Canna indica]
MAQGSPGSKLRKSISHGRGCSLGIGLPLKSIDDDLVLFTEMQKHETAKMRCISDSNLEPSISDLLKVDGDKDEYNWLLTPPDTPPVVSPDDDVSQAVNTPRSRRTTQKNSIQRQLMYGKTPRVSSSLKSFLAPKLNCAPQSKPLTLSTPKSSTPEPLSMRIGAIAQGFSCSRKGASPVKATHGRSDSSKNSTDPSSKFRRQSTSPSASKHASSSNSDRKYRVITTSCSKTSAAASDDDDDDTGSSRQRKMAFKQIDGGSKYGVKHEKTFESTNLGVADETCIEKAVLGEDVYSGNGISVASDTSCRRLPSPEFCFHLLDSPVAGNLNDEKSMKDLDAFFQNDTFGILDCSSIEDIHPLNGIGFQDHIYGAATQNSSNFVLDEQDDHCFHDSQSNKVPNYTNASESNCAEHPPCQANIAVEDLRKITQITFTMEEATDNIIFCSSIVHDLAYKVANIVMGNETAAIEGHCPKITHSVKSVTTQKYLRDTYYRRIKKSRNLKRKRQDTDNKKAPKNLGNNDKHKELAFSSDIMKPPKLESKCNCTIM